MTEMKPLLVSVVRDEAMYRRCIAANPFCVDCELLKIDNRAQNETIPVLYNRVLDGLVCSVPCWIFFAHEDFELLEPVDVRAVADLDVTRLYGVIGGRLVPRKRWLLGGVWGGGVLRTGFAKRKERNRFEVRWQPEAT